jgi:hypothetical protein
MWTENSSSAAAVTLGAREPERRFHACISLTIRLRDECYRIPDISVKALPYEKAPILTRRALPSKSYRLKMESRRY